MDLYNFQNIKAVKAKANMKYRRLQKVTAVFRLIEFCIFAIVFSRFSLHWPRAFKLSENHFREIFVSLISPRFVFVVGNAIVIILFLKSKSSSPGIDEKKCANDSCIQDESHEQMNKLSISVSVEEEQDEEEEEEVTAERKRKIKRSRSESWGVRSVEEPSKDLRRSSTVKCCRKSEEKAVETDQMSNEEFRRKVEDFIARQQRLLREEEFSAFV